MATVQSADWYDSEERERMRLAQRIARLWTWDYDVAQDSVLWTIPHESGDRIVRSTFEGVLGLVLPEDRDRVRKAIETTLHTGGEYALEHRAWSKSGKVHWLAARGALTSRKPLRMIGITVDICPLKRLEELRRIEDQAAMAGEAAHAINNPLQVVVNSLHLAKAEPLTPAAANHIDAAEQGAYEVARAVQEVLRRLHH